MNIWSEFKEFRQLRGCFGQGAVERGTEAHSSQVRAESAKKADKDTLLFKVQSAL